MQSKRGISGVIVTVLLILLAIVAVLIVWQIVSSTIKDTREKVSPSDILSGLVIVKPVTIDGSGVHVTVRRDSENANILKVRIKLENLINFNITDCDISTLGVLETKRCDIIPLPLSNITKVSIYPVINKTSGAEVGPLADAYNFPSTPVSTCAPNCSNKQCGSNGCGGYCGTCTSGNHCNLTSQICVSDIAGCSVLDKRCSGNILQNCTSGSWGTSENCTASGKVCNSTSLQCDNSNCAPSPCSPSQTERVCQDNTNYKTRLCAKDENNCDIWGEWSALIPCFTPTDYCNLITNNCENPPPITISSCSYNAAQAGRTYVLSSNLIATNRDNCINITADNINLDCREFSITNTQGGYAGIYSPSLNITIKNCNIIMSQISWAIGIYLSGSNKSNLYNINISTSSYGLYLDSVFSSKFEKIKLTNNDQWGIKLMDGNNNVFNEINSSSNTLGGLFIYSSSFNNFTNIVSNSNKYSTNGGIGVYFTSSNNNFFVNLTANSNQIYGLSFYTGNNNNITASTICNNGVRDITCASGSNFNFGTNDVFTTAQSCADGWPGNSAHTTC